MATIGTLLSRTHAMAEKIRVVRKSGETSRVGSGVVNKPDPTRPDSTRLDPARGNFYTSSPHLTLPASFCKTFIPAPRVAS